MEDSDTKTNPVGPNNKNPQFTVPVNPYPIIQELELLEAQMIVFQRLSTSLDSNRGQKNLTFLAEYEIKGFIQIWSEEILELCLKSGISATEIRRSLITGVLPNLGVIRSLASLRESTNSVQETK